MPSSHGAATGNHQTMNGRKEDFSPQVEQHLNADLDVSRARLEAFGGEDVDSQLRVIAALRARADNQEASQLLGVHSMSIAVLALILALIPGLVPAASPLRWGPYLWVGAVVLFLVVNAIDFIVVVVLAPIMIDQFRVNSKREQAVVWLGACQDELARLRGQTGKSGRAWRREHPL